MTDLIIEASELEETLGQHCVLDCRFSLTDAALGRTQYQQGHIPTAQYINLDLQLSGNKKETGGRHPLPELATFAQILADLGITQASSVVVYDNNKLAYACRAWWLLKSAGVKNVRILNGGYDAWINGRHKVEALVGLTEVNAVRTEIGQWELPLYNYSDVSDAVSGKTINLVDSREEKRFRGELEPIDPVAGHIPTAINKPWAEVTDEQGFIKNAQFQRERWSDLAPDKPLVIYCGSGVTATVNIFSAYLSGREAALYAGSWSDWCSRPNAIIATKTD